MDDWLGFSDTCHSKKREKLYGRRTTINTRRQDGLNPIGPLTSPEFLKKYTKIPDGFHGQIGLEHAPDSKEEDSTNHLKMQNDSFAL